MHGLFNRFLIIIISVLTGTSQLCAQSITGIVYDAHSNEPLIGATVMIKGEQGGTITDIQGKFSIATEAQSGVIEVSYIGYIPQKQPFKKGESIIINLVEDNRQLDEVVVIGYGVQRKSDLTGSVASINSKELASTPTTSVVQALQGKAAGVEVVQNSGAPGSSTSIRIRGMGTINDSDPLYVVDGMPMDDINYLASEDIVNIEILKDAASAAIYGSRAANGVVLITTKSGIDSKKKLNISVNASVGIQDIYNKPDILSKSDYAKFSDYVQNAPNYTVISTDGSMNFTDNALTEISEGNDWWDLATRTGIQSKLGVALSGGDKQLNYYVSANLLDSKGIIDKSGYQRMSFTAKINTKLAKNLQMGANITYSHEDRNIVSEGTRSVVKSAITYNPLQPVLDMNDTYTWLSPVENLRRLSYGQGINNFIGQLKLDWDIVKALKFSTRASYATYNSDVDRMQRHNASEKIINDNYYTIIKNPVTTQNFSWDNILTWIPRLNEKHNLNIMVGQTMEVYDKNVLNSTGKGYGGYDKEFNSLGFAAFDQSSNSYNNGYTSLGLLGRVSYSFLNRYLLQTNFRADASSRFSKKNRWGYFPSVSVGWKLNEEPWLREQSWLSLLKVRAGWGQLGNNRIKNLARLTLISYDNEDYIYGVGTPTVKPGYAITSYGNPDIKWERTESTTVGLDLNMFNNRFTASIEYFVKDTKDMLLEVPLVYSAGWADTPYQNAGSIRNKGFEVQVGWRDQIGNFGYGISGNLTKVNNKVTSLGQYGEPVLGGNLSTPNKLGYVTRTVLNAPIGTYYGYRNAGIMQESDFDANGKPLIPVIASSYAYNPGDRKYVDINGDGVIDDNDKTIIGNPHPDFFYAFNINLNYKNFDLQMFFQGVQGNEVFNVSKYFLYSNVTYNGSWTSNFDYSNVASDYISRVYRPEKSSDYRSFYGPNVNGDVPAPTSVSSRGADNFAASDWYIEDGSYLRLKQLQLNYTFPKSIFKKANIQSLKVYASVSNLFTLTHYSGLDPEVGKSIGDEANTSIGIDQGTYPQARTFMFGVIFDF